MWRAREFLFYRVSAVFCYCVCVPVCIMCNITFIDPKRFPIVSFLSLSFFLFCFLIFLLFSLHLYLSFAYDLLYFVSFSVAISLSLFGFLSSWANIVSFSPLSGSLKAHCSFPPVLVSLNLNKITEQITSNYSTKNLCMNKIHGANKNLIEIKSKKGGNKVAPKNIKIHYTIARNIITFWIPPASNIRSNSAFSNGLAVCLLDDKNRARST